MFRTLFLSGLGIERGSRVWDVWAFEGDRTLIRTAIAVLAALEGRLYGTREEVLDLLGWGGVRAELDLGDEETFMARVREAGKMERRKNSDAARIAAQDTAAVSPAPMVRAKAS